MINLHESMVPARIKLATPGSAVRHASVARHATDCATRPGMIDCSVFDFITRNFGKLSGLKKIGFHHLILLFDVCCLNLILTEKDNCPETMQNWGSNPGWNLG